MGVGGDKLLPHQLRGLAGDSPRPGEGRPGSGLRLTLKSSFPEAGEGRELHFSVQIDEPTGGAEGFWHLSSPLQRVSVTSPQSLHQSEERACVP